ncbi:hypothetical protein TRFO_04284 [Tritrichomonas foetus]|uniref:PAS domain-containing protein n=1 Tax=Tritrichomonas foetus TaxID=1144522 RepID=A0A1J4KGT6_9EUKA|nr:hypothetical protein TRFO_04284 [Tritrichomonas foetus]|eukprot:OHT10266.1 hypothetical protein TRFO_04284 [Tritrichomonas foetus]
MTIFSDSPCFFQIFGRIKILMDENETIQITSTLTGKQLFLYSHVNELPSSERFLFPFFHEMSINGKIPRWVYNIKYGIYSIQVIASLFWLTSTHIWPKKNIINEILSTFIDLQIHSFQNPIVYFICGIIVFLLLLTWNIFLIRYYKRTRKFLKYQLIVSKVLYMVIAPLSTPIFSSFLARAFLDMIDYQSIGSIIFFIIYLFIFFITLILSSIALSFKLSSPIIENCFMIEWTPIFHSITLLSTAIAAFGPILSRFYEWIQLVYVFGFAVVHFISFLFLQMFPFYKSIVNVGLSIVSMYFFFQEIFFSFKILLSDNLSMTYAILVPVILTVICSPIYGYYYYRRRKNILSFLSANNLAMTIDEKENRFRQQKLHNFYQIFPFFQLGIENNADFFVDWSFLFYLRENVKQQTLLLYIAHIMCFLPSLTDYLSLIVEDLEKYEFSSLSEQFKFYQIKKILLMRETAASIEKNDDILKLRKISKDSISKIRGFWFDICNNRKELNCSMFYNIYSKSNQTKMLFLDMVNKYSNNYEIYDLYTYYLIEGMADFSSAIVSEQNKKLIENGLKIDRDCAFISFVNMFPHYLTKKIIDIQGTIIPKNEVILNGTYISYAPIIIEDANEEILDEMGDIIDSSINQGKLRIAFQNGLKPMKFHHLQYYETFLIFQMIIVSLLFIFIMVYIPSIHNDSTDLFDCISYINTINVDILYIAYAHSIQAATDLWDFWPDYITDQTHISDSDMELIQSVSQNSLSIMNTNEMIHKNLEHFLDSLTKAEKLNSIRSEFVKPIINIEFFKDYYPSYSIANITIRQVLVFMSELSSSTTKSYDEDPWGGYEQIDDRTTVSYNSLILANYINSIRSDLVLKWTEISNKHHNFNDALGILFGCAVLVIMSPINLYLIIALKKEVYHNMTMMKRVKSDIIERSLLPISLQQKNKSPLAKRSIISQDQKDYIFIALFIVSIFLIIFSAVLLFLGPFFNHQSINSLNSCLIWHYLSSMRYTSIISAFTSSMLAHVINNEKAVNNTLSLFYNESLKILRESHLYLINGYDLGKSIFGIDIQLHDYHFTDTCTSISTNSSSYSEYIKCLSLDRSVSLSEFLLMKMYERFDPPPNFYEETAYTHLIVLIELKLNEAFNSFNLFILNYANECVNKNDERIYIISATGIVVMILLTLLLLYGLIYLQKVYEGIKQMIRFIRPSDIINNTYLFNFIVYDSDSSTSMSKSQVILSNVKESICSLSLDCTIETVNPSFTKLIGYSKEQILGQNFFTLFSTDPEISIEEHNNGIETLITTFENMRMSENHDFLQRFNLHCELESYKSITVDTIVYGLSEYNKCTEFVIIMKDLMNEKNEKNKILLAKKKNDAIIKKILPIHAFNAVRMENKPTLFSSNSVTIIAMKINGFNESVHSLQPRNLLQVIENFFSKIDVLISKYAAVQQLITFDDKYIACCGFFDQDKSPSDQVTQAVFFSLDCIEQLNQDQYYLNISINFGDSFNGYIQSGTDPNFQLNGEVFETALQIIDICSSEYKIIVTESVKFNLANGSLVNVNPILRYKDSFPLDLYDVSRMTFFTMSTQE